MIKVLTFSTGENSWTVQVTHPQTLETFTYEGANQAEAIGRMVLVNPELFNIFLAEVGG